MNPKLLGLSCLGLLGIWLGLGPRAGATMVRYAIVVGNNHGADENGKEPFPPLRRSEEEARRVRDTLVELGNFSSHPSRTILLPGATREQIHQAVRTIEAQKKRDREVFGQAESLFLFFFSGHGLRGRLLMHDGPITLRDLGDLFRTVNADFSVGIFDACFSGSLDINSLAQKGLQSNPGLNLFRELPEEVLTSQGSMWFVSSGPDQASYEDPVLGGVFTHFFLEAMKMADRDGPGISLERIWSYAQRQTVDYTARHLRRQTPQQYIAKLKTSGPLFFSFPEEQNSLLVLDASVQGRFVLSYEGGQLLDVALDARKQRRAFAVFPGKARLMWLQQDRIYLQEEIELLPKSTLFLSQVFKGPAASAIGVERRRLWEKGQGAYALTATAIRPVTSLLLGASYSFGSSPSGSLYPDHAVLASLRLDRSRLSLGLRAGYGAGSASFPSWSYRVQGALLEGLAGYNFELAPFFLTPAITLRLAKLWQEFAGGEERDALAIFSGATLRLLYPFGGSLALECALGAGVSRAPGEGIQKDAFWAGWWGIDATLYFQIR